MKPDTLDRLAALLRKRPLTAREIADVMGCCKPTAYERIEALKRRGDAVYSLERNRTQPGPRALAYGVR